MEGFERFQLAGLALLCLKNETKEETERDLRALISAAANDERERARRERLLQHLQSTDKADPLELAKYSLESGRREFVVQRQGEDGTFNASAVRPL